MSLEKETERKRGWSERIAHHCCSVFLVRREYLAGRTDSPPRLRERSTSAVVSVTAVVVVPL